MAGWERGPSRAWVRAFTLIEIVFVLAVFAVLAAIALPNWGALLPDYNLKAAARQVQSELHRIKSQAISENVTYQLVFSASGDNYTVQRVAGSTTTLGIKGLPEGIDLKSSITVAFNARGTASSSGTVKLCNNKNAGYNVAVSDTGRIQICAPSACNGTC